MELIYLIIVAVVVAILTWFLVSFRYKRMLALLEERVGLLDSAKRSLSSKYGKMSEHFIPFLDTGHDSEKFRFLGTPIDGVFFEDGKITFAEFKIGGSRLAPVQKRVKELIQEGKVDFKVFRVNEKGLKTE